MTKEGDISRAFNCYYVRRTRCMLVLTSSRTTFHLAASQENMHASLLPLTDVDSLGYLLPVRAHPPIKVYTYPLVSASPPFPLSVKPPASYTAYEGKTITENPYLISAAELSRTRTLETFKKWVDALFTFAGQPGLIN